eukprot:3118036-Alexandrium_andersonii.AAC.1
MIGKLLARHSGNPTAGGCKPTANSTNLPSPQPDSRGVWHHHEPVPGAASAVRSAAPPAPGPLLGACRLR